jgi:hypothetical protein
MGGSQEVVWVSRRVGAESLAGLVQGRGRSAIGARLDPSCPALKTSRPTGDPLQLHLHTSRTITVVLFMRRGERLTMATYGASRVQAMAHRRYHRPRWIIPPALLGSDFLLLLFNESLVLRGVALV